MLPWRLDAATVITPLQPEGAKSMSAKPEPGAKSGESRKSTSNPIELAKEAAREELAKEVDKAAKEKATKETASDKAAGSGRPRDGSLLVVDDDDLNFDLPIEIPTLKKRIERFRHLSPDEKQAQIVDGIFRYGPYAMRLRRKLQRLRPPISFA